MTRPRDLRLVACVQPVAAAPARSTGPSSLDPYAEHCAFPARWRAYLIAHFGDSPAAIARAFQVDERAARKWLSGECGCNGSKVVVAVQMHPETAPAILFPRAA